MYFAPKIAVHQYTIRSCQRLHLYTLIIGNFETKQVLAQINHSIKNLLHMYLDNINKAQIVLCLVQSHWMALWSHSNIPHRIEPTSLAIYEKSITCDRHTTFLVHSSMLKPYIQMKAWQLEINCTIHMLYVLSLKIWTQIQKYLI